MTATVAAVLALLEALLSETPAIIAEVKAIVAAFEGKQVAPLDFKDQSAALDAKLHGGK